MRAMTPIQYVSLLEEIREEFRFGKPSKKFPMGIKYISATFDTRTGSIYRVVIHKFFDENDIVLSVTNITENDIRKGFANLYDYVLHYLKSD